MYDIVLEKVLIYDGSGGKPYPGNLAVEDGRLGERFVTESPGAFPVFRVSYDPEAAPDLAIIAYGGMAGEALEAIDKGDMDNLCEELGDVLFQVMLHSQIAEEEGYFTIEDVVDGICDKMVFRHPQVFGGENAAPDGGVPLTWEELKNLDKLRKNRYKNR